MNTIQRSLTGPFPHQLDKDGRFVYGIYGSNTVIAWGGYSIDRALDRRWEFSNEHNDWKQHVPLNIGIFEVGDIDLPLEDAKALIELLTENETRRY